MAREQGNDIDRLSNEELEELGEQMQDQKEEDMEEQMELSQEFGSDYGAPEPEQKLNSHSFLHRAAFDSSDTTRTTFLQDGELGKPLFTIRTMLDLEDISNHYINPLLAQFGLTKEDNIISSYFKSKIQNVTDSGMSNKGFAMNLNVTQKKDVTRKKTRDNNIQNLKGGNQ